RVLLGYADVVVALGHLLLEDVETGAGVHRRRDAADALVALALVHERLAEDRRVLRRRRLREAGGAVLLRRRGGRAVDDRGGLGRVPLLHTLEAALLGGRKTLALHRLDMDDHGA